MEWILFLSIMFVLMFLLVVAFLYFLRPEQLIINNGVDNPDIDMWKVFVIGLLSAVILVTIIFAYYCGRPAPKDASGRDCPEKKFDLLKEPSPTGKPLTEDLPSNKD